MLFILIGLAILLKKLAFPFPDWLFTWPMILILLGLLANIKHRFQNGFGYILMILGGIFLARNSFGVDFPLEQFALPGILILVGIAILFRRKRSPCWRGDSYWEKDEKNQRYWRKYREPANKEAGDQDGHINMQAENSDKIDFTAVFCGIRKLILSKNFQGGDSITVFGGTEIDFSQADIQEKAVLDTVVVFGGLKLVIPPHWDIQLNMTNIAGGVEDRRVYRQNTPDPEKTLELTGTVLFGGIEIESF